MYIEALSIYLETIFSTYPSITIDKKKKRYHYHSLKKKNEYKIITVVAKIKFVCNN